MATGLPNVKRLPREMRAWYFPFDWDVRLLWALEVPTESRSLAELAWHLDIPIWSKAKGMHFDLCPREVIENPGRHPRHDARIERSEVAYAIDIMFTVDRFAILDGVHRLAKHAMRGSTDVPVRVIPRAMIPLFATDRSP